MSSPLCAMESTLSPHAPSFTPSLLDAELLSPENPVYKHLNAITRLADRYKDRCVVGMSDFESDKEAVRLYTEAAASGFKKAENNLAFMHYKGRVAGLSQADSDKEALHLFLSAAAEGHPIPLSNLVKVYSDRRAPGLTDEQCDLQARHYTALAGESYLNYAETAISIEPNDAALDKKTVHWFEMAIAAGKTEALPQLAMMTALGRGTDKDIEKAFSMIDPVKNDYEHVYFILGIAVGRIEIDGYEFGDNDAILRELYYMNGQFHEKVIIPCNPDDLKHFTAEATGVSQLYIQFVDAMLTEYQRHSLIKL